MPSRPQALSFRPTAFLLSPATALLTFSSAKPREPRHGRHSGSPPKSSIDQVGEASRVVRSVAFQQSLVLPRCIRPGAVILSEKDRRIPNFVPPAFFFTHRSSGVHNGTRQRVATTRSPLVVLRGPARDGERQIEAPKIPVNTRIVFLAALAATAAFTTAAVGGNDLDQLAFPRITAQPIDQAFHAGSSVMFAVGATNADGYPWPCNGVVLDGQPNRSLAIQDIGTNDVGYYSCAVHKGGEVVPTREASLNAYTEGEAGQILVYGCPVVSGDSQGSCPGSYIGYVTYIKTVSLGR